VVVGLSGVWWSSLPCNDSLDAFFLLALLPDDSFCFLPGSLLLVALEFLPLSFLQSLVLSLDYPLRLVDGELVTGCWGLERSLGSLE
jgi:hypothetical protein